ncbi:hypothetical protein BN13_280015 [Nostocoides jenkinsii Ben 74]|uniref:Uncharacterized protein n=1 Tax=Nostocoides jenkinsii Ben 74 TaxID=1193518 RepID=A0A077MDX6_9MICO|nr:hypothetical protein BN13_280015 [Tetrasphaera jenkinsii Ben 74]
MDDRGRRRRLARDDLREGVLKECRPRTRLGETEYPGATSPCPVTAAAKEVKSVRFRQTRAVPCSGLGPDHGNSRGAFAA